ncbi:MAG: YegP family protein [Flavitalea sp.]
MGFPRISIYKDLYDHYYFRLADAEGETILTSVTYRLHSDCTYAIRTMRTVILNKSCYQFQGSVGNYYFTIFTRENITIASSKYFRTLAGREAGVELLQKIVPVAEVEDRSLFVKYIRV